MKNTTKLVGIIVMAIMAIAIIGCKGDDSPVGDIPKVQPDTIRTLSFGTNCKVTIKSDDLFTNTEWITLCNSVVSTIEANYKSGSQGSFEEVFASAKNNVVLVNNLTNNWEVRDGKFDTAYIKTASIGTVNFNMIIMHMKNDTAGKDPA